MKKINLIFYILLSALAVRLIFLFDYHEIWWDAAVYIGMGKYILSFAQQGLWEPIRPIIWPLLLGLIWKIKINTTFFGIILTTMFSLAIIYLTYSIAKENYDKNTAAIASILVAFSSIFFFFNYRLYVEIPSLFFVLLSLFLIYKKRYFFSGISIALAFLTKFPSGIFLITLLPLIIYKKDLKPFFYYIAGFTTATAPYLILNYILYNNPVFPFTSASEIITKVAGCNYINYHPWHSYFIFIIKDNFFNIFTLAGLYFTLKKPSRKNITVVLSLLFPLVYFMQMNCREYRYIIMFIPFLSILSAYGISKSFSRVIKKYSKIIFIIIGIISITLAMTYYYDNEPKAKIIPREEFYHFATGKNITGEIWIANPQVNLYVQKKVKLLYYPLYTSESITDIEDYMITSNTSYIFLDTCGGGMTCIPEDTECKRKTAEFISSIKSNFNQKFHKKFGICDYYIFEENDI